MHNESEAPTTVLYVAGWGRSGSTLLARMFGEHPDAVYVGELRDLWFRGLRETRRCGCGEPFPSCPFWTRVGQRAVGGWDQLDGDAMRRYRARLDKPWVFPALLRDRVPGPLRADLGDYVALLGRIVDAIREETGSTIVVDSSKLATFALLLDRADATDVRIAHLVRDPRGTAYSWQRRVQRPDTVDGPSMMLRYRPGSAAARYLLYNRQADRLASRLPYVRLRYEDLITDPERHVRDITAALGLPVWDPGRVLEGSVAHLGPSHSIMGNPMRMNQGGVALRSDDAWRGDLAAGTRRVVTTVTAPALRRYGYPLRPS